MDTNDMMIYSTLMDSNDQVKRICPQCKKEEYKKVLCRNCGYEYKEEEYEPMKWWQILLVVICAVLVLWVGATILFWLADNLLSSPGSRKSLIQMVVAQWEFVKNLKVW